MTPSGRRGAQRSPWYPGLVGVAAGALIAGLIVPFVRADRESIRSIALPTPVDRESTTRDPSSSAGTMPAVGDSTTPTTAVTRDPRGSPRAGVTLPASAAAGGAPGLPPTLPLRATDSGVSASSIKVAFLLLDLGQAGRLGVNTTGVDPKQQRAAFEAFVEDLNQRGGIAGRTVEPHYRVFDTTSPADQRAACLAATEDVKAFAVVAMPGFINSAVLCVTQEHQTPLVLTGQGISREFLRKSEGRLVTLQMAGDRMMLNFAATLDDGGLLDGRTIGIVSSEEPQYIETVERVLVPELRRLGHSVGHVTRLAAFPGWQGQITPEIQRMRAAGVDTVIFVTPFLAASSWVQTAEHQGWLPRYLVSEWSGMTSDFELQAMPRSFEGALAMTSQRFGEWRAGVAPPAAADRCVVLYEKQTGERLPRNNGNESNSAYPVILYACDMFRVFEATAKVTGPELTRSSWVAAVQRTGAIDGAFYFPGSFGPDKTDLTDHLRFIRADISSCRCWRNADAVRPARFR